MSTVAYRPIQAVDYGQVATTGQGNVLGDGVDGTYKSFVEDSGSIMVYPAFNPALIPSGRSAIAVKCIHRHVNGGFFNGWAMSYLRINQTRIGSTKAYKQDGSSGTSRNVEGTALYAPGLVPWTVAQLSTMSTDVGSATGEFGPNKNNKWCIVNDSWIGVVLDDDVPVPNTPFPANGGTVATSSVNFSATQVPTQIEQPVAAVFQVARDAAFTTDVRTFVGGLNQSIAAGSKSYYASNRNDGTYTNLGPGLWYLRMKGRDYRTVESAWGVTTTFTVAHGALPIPTPTKPTPGTNVPTPYGVREATFATDPTGDRKVGAQWQFSKVSDFSSGVVTWTNNMAGRFDKGVVRYDAQPNSGVTPGLTGDKVSVDDPSQYLSQGVWYARTRAVDIFNQVGSWSGSVSFTVTHPPVVADVRPQSGKAFDDDARAVTWKFTDPWDADNQGGYQIAVIEPVSQSFIYNSGFVQSPLQQAKVVIPDSYLQQTLRLNLLLWDKDLVQSTSIYVSDFRLSKSPVITVPYPAVDEAIITGQPTITWSCVFARAGVTQKSFQIAFIRRDTGNIEYSTQVFTSTATTWAAPTTVLQNLSAYQMALTIVDSDDLSTTLLRNFTTNYIKPEAIQCSAFAETYEDDGYVTVLWPDIEADPLFVEFRIYRKKVDEAGAPWVLAGTVGNRNQYEYHDWSVGGADRYRYTLTQVSQKYGALVESDKDEFGDIVSIVSSQYWLITPDDESKNIRLHAVVGDKFTRRVEMAEYNIINGGRRVTYGASIGIDGTLSAQVRYSSRRSATQQLALLEELQLYAGWVMLRDPFGNFTKVALGEIGVSRIAGVGVAEYADLEIPYFEVR